MTIAEGTQRLPVEELRKLFLFEKLSDEQLQWLARHGRVTSAPSGATFLAEGDPAELFVVLLSGAITMSRRVGQDDVETVRTDQVGVYAGAMQAYLADPAERMPSTRSAGCTPSSAGGKAKISQPSAFPNAARCN